MSPRLDSLPAIEDALWRTLQDAVRDKSHPWRTPVLATTDGDIGDARTVVLREADRDRAALRLYCDARSPKAAQLVSHPVGTLVMWSPVLGWQLRVRVRVEVSTEGLEVSSRWARLKLSPAAHDYLSAQPPGTPLEAALSARGERAHFALLDAHVQSIDWLELHADGHRRARFVAGTTPCWLQP
jgi:pyridoxine/pyridoxamine 5'-phosphate oxidase